MTKTYIPFGEQFPITPAAEDLSPALDKPEFWCHYCAATIEGGGRYCSAACEELHDRQKEERAKGRAGNATDSRGFDEGFAAARADAIEDLNRLTFPPRDWSTDPSPLPADAPALFAAIAAGSMGIETLETRNSDRLDFHDVHVGSIAAALELAYRAGMARGAS